MAFKESKSRGAGTGARKLAASGRGFAAADGAANSAANGKSKAPVEENAKQASKQDWKQASKQENASRDQEIKRLYLCALVLSFGADRAFGFQRECAHAGFQQTSMAELMGAHFEPIRIHLRCEIIWWAGASPDGAVYATPSLWLASHPVYSSFLKLAPDRWAATSILVTC